MSHKRTIAVDFDGVIHAYRRGWQDGSVYDSPVDDAKETLAWMIRTGYTVIIFTTRYSSHGNQGEALEAQKVAVEVWLDYWGFKEGEHYHSITGEKPLANIYIDDRGIRFTNWVDMKNYL